MNDPNSKIRSDIAAGRKIIAATVKHSLRSMAVCQVLCILHTCMVRQMTFGLLISSIAAWIIWLQLVGRQRLSLLDKIFVYAGVLVLYILVAVISQYLFDFPLLPDSNRHYY